MSHRLLTTLLFSLIFYAAFAQKRLLISPDMVYNLSGQGDVSILFDEQPNLDGVACVYPKADNPWRYFDAVRFGKTFYYPVDVVVELDSSYTLTQICLEKGGGQESLGAVQVCTGGDDPTTWTNLFTYQRSDPACRDVDVATQYVKFRFVEPTSRLREISLFATELNQPPCPPFIQRDTDDCLSTRFPMQDFIGSNINFDVPAVKTNAVGIVRNYHSTFQNTGFGDVNYVPYPNNVYDWYTVNEETEEVFHVDRYFERLKDIGQTVSNALHRAPPYLVTFDYFEDSDINDVTTAYDIGLLSQVDFIRITDRKPFDEQVYPIEWNKAYDQPEMYTEYADLLYQFTARYGGNENANFLKVDSDNDVVAGLDMVEYIENWNEPDKWWHGATVSNYNFLLDPKIEEQLGYFSPFEYAAMSSATYDGHGLTNGINNVLLDRYPNDIPSVPVGVQLADSTMKMVLSGVSELNPDYFRAVKFWFDHYRSDIEFPFDVLTFHDYSNNGFGEVPLANYAVSPEEYGLRARLEEMVDFRDRYLPDLEIWLSEFGYDSSPFSIQAPNCQFYCDDCDSQVCRAQLLEIQAQWLVRSFLEIAAAGVDRAMLFNMRDGSAPGAGGLYQSSGLTTYRLDRFQNKPSWYYISSLKQILSNTYFDPSFEVVSDSIHIYRFVNDCDAPEKEVYAIWSPTSTTGSDAAILTNYQLPFSIDSSAILIELADGDADGIRRELTTDATIDVSERPKFVVFGELSKDMDGCDCGYLEFSVSGNANIEALNDEQDQIGAPYCGEGNTMQTIWEAKNGDEVILDLSNQYSIDYLFLHSDTLGEGALEIYAGSPLNWELVDVWKVANETDFRWKMYNYQEEVETRYLRLRSLSATLNMTEVAICGTKIEDSDNPVTDLDGINIAPATSIRPNPFNSYFLITSPKSSHLRIVYTDGQVIWQGAVRPYQGISTIGWQSGIYFLQWIDENGVVVKVEKGVKAF
ncbi:MAG: T9SS type A sorting domain-containing protein [Bacteroidota bacterium]